MAKYINFHEVFKLPAMSLSVSKFIAKVTPDKAWIVLSHTNIPSDGPSLRPQALIGYFILCSAEKTIIKANKLHKCPFQETPKACEDMEHILQKSTGKTKHTPTFRLFIQIKGLTLKNGDY